MFECFLYCDIINGGNKIDIGVLNCMCDKKLCYRCCEYCCGVGKGKN